MNVEKSSGELIAGYSELLDRSRRMLEHAREGEWRALIQEESWFIAEAERLGRLEKDLDLSPDLQELKDELLERILERNLAVRHYLALRQESLQRSLDGESGAEGAEVLSLAATRERNYHANAGSFDKEPG